ncbi:hypothetical protein PTTG_06603 [Puccinia triticina 1-1 BBBD Race 1]|uniref:Uncharacterized protein n=1 Tax=Puccinia triticina (isolate 1-1 / race 1 (BBBD)) TaxID=630390 RepID=A0A180GBK5_PUCT1|nr:hypothetical protein PTTG_06603 [Puccinia triticina 1-1 BBBD Race 1]
MDWPYQLKVGRESYTLFSRGFWNGFHYWCKVLRSGRGSTTGVWLHDDQQNEGIARLVNTDPSSIGGCHPFTSFLFYSRCWTPCKEKYVLDSISKIKADHLNAEGDAPFVNLGSLIKPQLKTAASSQVVKPLEDGDYVDNFDKDAEEDSEASDLDCESDNNSSSAKSNSGDKDNTKSDSGDEDNTKLVLHPVEPAPKTIKLKLRIQSQPAHDMVAGTSKQPESPNPTAPPSAQADQPLSPNEAKPATRRSRRTSAKK